jgi:hypothetical protein
MNVMLMLKRVLAGALSSTLILLSVALFPPNALADGSNQAAAHAVSAFVPPGPVVTRATPRESLY